jgi:hypothetical protein
MRMAEFLGSEILNLSILKLLGMGESGRLFSYCTFPLVNCDLNVFIIYLFFLTHTAYVFLEEKN